MIDEAGLEGYGSPVGSAVRCPRREPEKTLFHHLRNHVFPNAAVRQWVLTLPMQLRFLLACRPKLIGSTLTLFLRAPLVQL